MRFSEMSKKQLKEAREELSQELRSTLRPSRVLTLTDNSVLIEGGTVPAKYEHNEIGGTLYIWGRCSRYAGGDISVSALIQAEDVVNYFFRRHLDV